MSLASLSPLIKHSIFLFDWDNTLFSTDYLKTMGFHFDAYFTSKLPATLEHPLIASIASLEQVFVN